MEKKTFTPGTFNKGKTDEITFDNDKDYYDYFKNNPDKKPKLRIDGHEIEMQTKDTLTFELVNGEWIAKD